MKTMRTLSMMALLLLTIFVMASCATIFSGSRSKVVINGSTYSSEPVNINADGRYYSNVRLPAEVKVKRKSKPSRVTITSPNYNYSDILVRKKFNAMFLGNIMLGGIIGMGVDLGTGAMYKPREKNFVTQIVPKESKHTPTISTETYTSTTGRRKREVIVVNNPQARTNEKELLPVVGEFAPVSESVPGIETSQSFLVSDVDSDIPYVAVKNTRTYVVVIANEDYQSEAKVPYAKNDGKVFAEYCRQVLGIPRENIDVFENASYNNIRKAISNAKMFADAAGKSARIIFYYAGHGIPDETSRSAYLLPVDGYGSDVTTGYKLDDLYMDLGNLPVSSVTVFIDACFSGSKREGDKLASARGIAIKVKQGMPVGNMIVFTASSGDETAYHYKDQSHGLFTYFLLKKLKETRGDITYDELFSYIQSSVKMASFQNYRKIQTPTVKASVQMNNLWRAMKLTKTK